MNKMYLNIQKQIFSRWIWIYTLKNCPFVKGRWTWPFNIGRYIYIFMDRLLNVNFVIVNRAYKIFHIFLQKNLSTYNVLCFVDVVYNWIEILGTYLPKSVFSEIQVRTWVKVISRQTRLYPANLSMNI